MQPGLVIAGRFEVERPAGQGGMGTVYRARDRERGGAPVALKLLRNLDKLDLERFERECRVLAALDVPGVVRHVAHGRAAGDVPFLAMEWLEGEDLAARLARGPLTVEETRALGRGVAAALVELHAHGVVHRDLKPANLHLRNGDPAQPVLLDFGVARRDDPAEFQTRTGSLVGTPAYMAPEQARGAREADERVDLYALGCVLFECLAGHALFQGQHAVAVLSKVLLEPAPRLSTLRADVPAGLERLIAALLEKSASSRPASASRVLQELERDAPRANPTPSSGESLAHGLTGLERRTLCVVLSGRLADAADAATPDTGLAPTLRNKLSLGALADSIRAKGGELEQLVDGSLLVMIADVTSDQASRAARCALALRKELPYAPVVIATGHGQTAARLPVGEVIDRAVNLLARGGPAAAGTILLDDVTAGLLDAHFEVSGAAGGLALVGERPVIEQSRTLFGVHTACVGRESELATLLQLYDDCASDARARAVLVTAPPGTGKSRVRFELLRALASREPAPEVWLCRGDSTGAGSPFGLLAGALRRDAGIVDGEPMEVQRLKLRARLGRNLRGEELERAAAFLGELAGVPLADDAHPQLPAARRDPILMGDQMQRAFEELLGAECAVRPRAIVLEDLHWGDLPTVRFLDAALRQLADRPLFVLALARPEIDESFPRLWADRDLTVIRLRPLSKKSCEKLIRQVLGASTPDDVVARIVERSGGNALFLEELLRAERDGKGEATPETVLALVEARIERLAPEARRVLRAASVFGQIFWRDGVAALLGDAPLSDATLNELVERELVVQRRPSRFPQTAEYIFRHAVMRDAAYAMLTDADRALGHRLAAGWLRAQGERDAVLLAQHLERGERAGDAVELWAEAARQALEGNDFAAAIERAERGARGATGELRASLWLVEAEAHRWRGELEAAESRALAAMEAIGPPAPLHYKAAAELASASGALAHADQLLALAEALELPAQPSDTGPRVIAAAHTVVQLNHLGQYALAQSLLDAARVAPGASSNDPAVRAWLGRAAGMRAASDANPGALLAACEQSVEGFEAAGDLRMAAFQRANLGYAKCVVGRWDEAVAVLNACEGDARRLGLTTVENVARSYRGYALVHAHKHKDGLALLRDTIGRMRLAGERRARARAGNYLALALSELGALDEAAAEIDAALAPCDGMPVVQGLLRATAAYVALRRGRTEEALAHARAALAVLAERGSVEDGECLLRATYAEALVASGDPGGAREEIRTARQALQRRAETIADPAVRAAFLVRVPENARTIALANKLG